MPAISPIFEGILRNRITMQEQMAETDLIREQIPDVQAQTQSRLQQILMNQKKMEAFDRQQKIDEAYRLDVAKSNSMGDPRVSNPDTTSIAATEDKNQSPYKKQLAFFDDQANQAQRNIQLSQKYGYDPKQWVTMLEKANEQRRILAQDITKDNREKAQQTANILRDVNSPAAASAALEHVRSAFGDKAAQELDAKLPHDQAGNILWNERAKMALAPYVSQYTSMADSNKKAHDAATLERQMSALEETKRHDRAIEWKASQDVALRREGLEQRKSVYEAAGFGKVVATTQKDQAALDKTANNYKIIDYQKGNEVASRVESALLDPTKGYESISAPNARVLVEQGKLMMDNYRARTGGKYQDQQVGRMNSLLGRAEKFIDTIGEGDKLLAKDVMLQMAREMKTMYADRNADLLKDELRVAEKTNMKGGNAALLSMRGDINAAVESGKAKKVTLNGKDYIAFGKNKEDIFEVPTMPERFKNISPFATE